jgi:uncharacterized OsmC-like protein
MSDTKPAVGETVAITSSTIGLFGRYLLGAGKNHFVSDQRAAAGGPGEAITAGELLLSSLGSCSLGLIQKAAVEQNIPLTGAGTEVAFQRHANDPTRYEWIRIAVRLYGVADEQAAILVGAFANTCPIYNTLKRGGPIEISWTVN